MSSASNDQSVEYEQGAETGITDFIYHSKKQLL